MNNTVLTKEDLEELVEKSVTRSPPPSAYGFPQDNLPDRPSKGDTITITDQINKVQCKATVVKSEPGETILEDFRDWENIK